MLREIGPLDLTSLRIGEGISRLYIRHDRYIFSRLLNSLGVTPLSR